MSGDLSSVPGRNAISLQTEKKGTFFEHCAEIPGQCDEQMKLYRETISDGWTAQLE
jgi:hypothetical protein